MLSYELTVPQVQNLKALLMDANIKGSAASMIVELVNVLDHPVKEDKVSDIHGEHNDTQESRDAAT